MINFIKAEWFKLIKPAGFKVLILCSVVIGNLCLLVSYLEGKVTTLGYDELVMSLKMILYSSLLGYMLAAIFICNEFTQKGFGNVLLCGFTRKKIFFAKLIVFLIGFFLICLAFMAVPLVIALANGFGAELAEESFKNILLNLFYFVLDFMVQGAVIVFVALFIKKAVLTVSASMLISYIFFIVKANLPFMEKPVIKPFMEYIYLYQIISFEWNEDGFTDCKYIFVMVITLIVAVAGAAFIFEKAELK